MIVSKHVNFNVILIDVWERQFNIKNNKRDCITKFMSHDQNGYMHNSFYMFLLAYLHKQKYHEKL